MWCKASQRYNQMVADMQTVLAMGVPSLVVLIGILINNSRLTDLNGRFTDLNGRFTDLRNYIDVRFTDLQQVIDARFAEQKAELLRVEQVMDARLRHLEENSR